MGFGGHSDCIITVKLIVQTSSSAGGEPPGVVDGLLTLILM
jgi:hypothetical protein